VKTNALKVMAVVMMGFLALGGEALAKKPATKKEVTGVVNLNTATAQQLDLLPGVGPKAAKRIIDERTRAPFAKVEDLTKVKGIGAKKLARLKPHLAVSGPTTIAAKKATLAAGELPAAPEAQGRSAPRVR
jgi:competence protein ComEA